MSLTGKLRALLDADCTPEEAADKVLTDDDILVLVRPLIIDAAKRIMRAGTRRVEKTVFEKGITWDDGAPRISSLRALVAERFPLPDGRWVNWLDATADDHRARADWQRGHANECVANAEKHELAADEIVRNNVTCLRDLLPKESAA